MQTSDDDHDRHARMAGAAGPQQGGTAALPAVPGTRDEPLAAPDLNTTATASFTWAWPSSVRSMRHMKKERALQGGGQQHDGWDESFCRLKRSGPCRGEGQPERRRRQQMLGSMRTWAYELDGRIQLARAQPQLPRGATSSPVARACLSCHQAGGPAARLEQRKRRPLALVAAGSWAWGTAPHQGCAHGVWKFDSGGPQQAAAVRQPLGSWHAAGCQATGSRHSHPGVLCGFISAGFLHPRPFWLYSSSFLYLVPSHPSRWLT